MNHVHTVSAFIQEPYEDVLRLVRRMLVRCGLRLATEIDITQRLEHEIGMEWKYASTVLVVDDPSSLYEALVQDSIAPVHVLQHVVVTGNANATRIAVRLPDNSQLGSGAGVARRIGRSVANRVADAIKSIAEHHSAIIFARSSEPVTAPLGRRPSAPGQLNTESYPAVPA